MKKVALITGGGRGIGFGIALKLAKDGYNIVIADIQKKEDVDGNISELESTGVEVLYCRCDISSADARMKMLEEIKEKFNCLNVLVNNAGVAPTERLDLLDATEASYERVMKINLQGPYFLTQAIANWMIKQKRENVSYSGSIINISSISSVVASTSRGEYCISKAGVSMATKLFAVRLGEHDIPVYEIRPGIIETDMTSGVKDKYDKLIEDGLLVQKRWGLPGDIANVVSMMVREYIAYSTGQIISVDGGLLLERL